MNGVAPEQPPVTLPRGLFDTDGTQHRALWLHPVTGYFEVQLAEQTELDANALSALLASAIKRIGGYADIGVEHTAALSRGDRDYVLLQVRRSLFGERMHVVLTCPNPRCCQEADVGLDVSELAGEPTQAAPELIHVGTTLGPVVLHEPTGADDAAVLRVAAAEQSALLWSRLIVDLAGRGTIEPQDWSALDATVRYAISLALAEGQSGPSLAFVVPCPHCEALIEVEFDPATLLNRELGAGSERLFAEVHQIAYCYHWEEHTILSLPRARRWRYLELLGRQHAGRPLLGGLR